MSYIRFPDVLLFLLTAAESGGRFHPGFILNFHPGTRMIHPGFILPAQKGGEGGLEVGGCHPGFILPIPKNVAHVFFHPGISSSYLPKLG